MKKEISEKYAGKWIAVIKDRVVVAGNSVSEVMKIIKQKKIKETPLVTKALRKDEDTFKVLSNW